MPVKSEAFALSSAHDAHAMYTGAVNTLAFSRIDGQLVARGFNTDVFGMTETLSTCGLSRTDHAVIFGGGATALSALVALNELGFHSVSVALRDVTKRKDLRTLATQLGVNLRVVDINSIHELDPVDAAVSTVPGSADVRFDNLIRTPSALLLDVAYDVWPSPRSLQWVSSGGIVASGLSMLAFQALRQVRIFVSDSPDVELQHESAVRSAMFASVGLNSRGL
jgi:shikimate dehydrogenase